MWQDIDLKIVKQELDAIEFKSTGIPETIIEISKPKKQLKAKTKK